MGEDEVERSSVGVRVVVVAVDVAAVLDVAFQPLHGEVEAAQAAGSVGLFDADDSKPSCGVPPVPRDPARRLHEHPAGATGGVEDAAVKRFDDFGEQADDATRRVELAAFLAFGAGEFAEEVFVDAPESVVVGRRRNLGNLLEQFLEQRAGEQVEGLGQHTGELWVELLYVAHRRVDLGADVGHLGQRQQIIEARLGAQIQNAFGVIGNGFIDSAASTGKFA